MSIWNCTATKMGLELLDSRRQDMGRTANPLQYPGQRTFCLIHQHPRERWANHTILARHMDRRQPTKGGGPQLICHSQIQAQIGQQGTN